jgi:hypothetical protein
LKETRYANVKTAGAFLAAALVLLVLPVFLILGLSALGKARHLGMASQLNG